MLEALACGTPVVLPHCGVFDELWAEHDGRAAWSCSSTLTRTRTLTPDRNPNPTANPTPNP